MQQRDQPGAAFVDQAEFLGDPVADLARRARQSRPDPGLQGLALLDAHFARAAAHLEAAEPFDAALLEKLIPAADRVVVEQENFGHFLTAHTLIQQHQRVGAPRHATGRQTIARANAISVLRSSSLRKPPRIMRPSESSLAPNASFF